MPLPVMSTRDDSRHSFTPSSILPFHIKELTTSSTFPISPPPDFRGFSDAQDLDFSAASQSTQGDYGDSSPPEPNAQVDSHSHDYGRTQNKSQQSSQKHKLRKRQTPLDMSFAQEVDGMDGNMSDEPGLQEQPNVEAAKNETQSQRQQGQHRDSTDLDHAQVEDVDEDEPANYDLKPPPPLVNRSNMEHLADRLFSDDHLNIILRDPNLFSRFYSFLKRYRPQLMPTLERYVEIQKAISAVQYANAISEHLPRGPIAALIEEPFEAYARSTVADLLQEALPAYLTHRFVQIATDTLVKEIIGQNTPLMHEMVSGLAEVYCMSDPSLPDNPIVYASEEFFRCTQYGRDYVIGRNCRFLQGPKSHRATISRLIEALDRGEEICETILNYRRDGSPFLNLLMVAPLYDNKGVVRYFIGAQIDINGLLEGGRGLESFHRLLAQDRSQARYGQRVNLKSPQTVLAELSSMLSENEIEQARKNAHELKSSESHGSVGVRDIPRRYFGLDDLEDNNLWPNPKLGSNGRLPGVFQNYLLVRPYPSLRITFTSPTLRIPGLLQSKFLDHIGGPPHVRDGILSAMSSGIGVTAKISWLTNSGDVRLERDGRIDFSLGQTESSTKSKPNSRAGSLIPRGDSQRNLDDGKPRWIHCTPLIGSDMRVGVWMIVLVETEFITGGLNVTEQFVADHLARKSMTNGGNANGALYRDYLRREGRDVSISEQQQQQSIQSQRQGYDRPQNHMPNPSQSLHRTSNEQQLGSKSQAQPQRRAPSATVASNRRSVEQQAPPALPPPVDFASANPAETIAVGTVSVDGRRAKGSKKEKGNEKPRSRWRKFY